MTIADFTAACFWPLVILFALLLKWVRDRVVRRWIVAAAVAVGGFYLVMEFTYGERSLMAVTDYYLFTGVLGVGAVYYGCRDLSSHYLTQKLRALSVVFCGVIFLGASGAVLIADFVQPRIVLEGRVQNVRIEGGRRARYVADIAGKTVNVTEPIYQRLKFLPVVRVEIGRGSEYVYRMDYLAN